MTGTARDLHREREREIHYAVYIEDDKSLYIPACLHITQTEIIYTRSTLSSEINSQFVRNFKGVKGSVSHHMRENRKFVKCINLVFRRHWQQKRSNSHFTGVAVDVNTAMTEPTNHLDTNQGVDVEEKQIEESHEKQLLPSEEKRDTRTKGQKEKHERCGFKA